MEIDTRYLYLLIRFNVLSLSLQVFNNPRFSAKADAKIQPISKLQKYFFKKVFVIGVLALNDSVLRKEKFYHTAGKRRRKSIF